LIVGFRIFIEWPIAPGVDTGPDIEAEVGDERWCITPISPRGNEAKAREEAHRFGHAGTVDLVAAASQPEEYSAPVEFLDNFVGVEQIAVVNEKILDQVVKFISGKPAVDDAPTQEFGFPALQGIENINDGVVERRVTHEQ